MINSNADLKRFSNQLKGSETLVSIQIKGSRIIRIFTLNLIMEVQHLFWFR